MGSRIDDVRRYVEAALGGLSPERAQRLARAMGKGQSRDQLRGAAKELLNWSQRNRDKLMSVVRREVKHQLRIAGVATKEDVEALKRRIRNLEKPGVARKPQRAKPRVAGRPNAKRAAPKKSRSR